MNPFPSKSPEIKLAISGKYNAPYLGHIINRIWSIYLPRSPPPGPDADGWDVQGVGDKLSYALRHTLEHHRKGTSILRKWVNDGEMVNDE